MKKNIKPVPQWQNPNWVYTPSVATDILSRFKQLGWIPPSEKLHKGVL